MIGKGIWNFCRICNYNWGIVLCGSNRESGRVRGGFKGILFVILSCGEERGYDN